MYQCIKFILFWNDTVHVSDGTSVHHQQFKSVRTATGICQTDTAVCLLAGTRYVPASKQTAVSVTLTATSNKELRKAMELSAPQYFLFYDRPKIYGLGKKLVRWKKGRLSVGKGLRRTFPFVSDYIRSTNIATVFCWRVSLSI